MDSRKAHPVVSEPIDKEKVFQPRLQRVSKTYLRVWHSNFVGRQLQMTWDIDMYKNKCSWGVVQSMLIPLQY